MSNEGGGIVGTGGPRFANELAYSCWAALNRTGGFSAYGGLDLGGAKATVVVESTGGLGEEGEGAGGS
ncbi:hypothetical protein AGABI1DRAFT_117170 [Agaricus bisporus var. burnettii JB137-S8]|uniref:Uncharacterized protein n=1 Tax=Agaricus bisporus var. burnettii (strain JB137-S8 / ATCC MYA-4627 / FGSC 10392) TaxID=597362 RepID=K5XJJ8_AGABU|nr:hypothetical protein AGABI2DRAFT_182505 [Agaricus bisporus var. bisporus H97]XP_007325533.1 uncharacterized protein AGABI1DRAFT_117170 [Agaricus bisporus var. burnettii JB137-S8]EKM83673.1 hypothetical protein AGABI1DRAFT_117170 [Agaricus bisporus var. burnettii JB137-S8]EKV51555.1 hypothetical protein AGABI2DRAFT_182505 [Agaricus bisporus var. bisporus H97]